MVGMLATELVRPLYLLDVLTFYNGLYKVDVHGMLVALILALDMGMQTCFVGFGSIASRLP